MESSEIIKKGLNLDSVTRSHQIWIHQKSSEVLQDESQFAIICRENCHRRSAILWTPSTCVSIICMCLSIYANFLLLTYISQITREHLLQSLYILCYSATCFTICKLLFCHARCVAYPDKMSKQCRCNSFTPNIPLQHSNTLLEDTFVDKCTSLIKRSVIELV